MERIFKEGHRHEPLILDDVEAHYGVRIARTAPDGDQWEIEIPVAPGLVIRGHLDGKTIEADPDDVRVVEAKALSKDSYRSWKSGGFANWEAYGSQISLYMYATGCKAIYAVKDRNSGAVDFQLLDTPPESVNIIKARVLQAEMYAQRGELPPCDRNDGFMCFVAGTLVMTRDGYRPIEQLVVGDEVLTHMSRWRPIVATGQRYQRGLRTIKAFGVPGLTATDEHPFWTRDRYYHHYKHKWPAIRKFTNPQWTEAAKLVRGQFLGQTLPPVTNEDQHSIAWWRFIGRYLADGWLVTRKKGLELCGAHEEEDELRELVEAAGYHGTRVINRTTTNFKITSQALYEELQSFGRLAHEKRLPGFVFALPVEKATALIEGYLSGDGHLVDYVSNVRPYNQASTVSRELALGFALLGQRAFGVIVPIVRQQRTGEHFIEGRLVNQRPNYTMRFPSQNRNALLEGNYGWKPLYSSMPTDDEAIVYNIQVAEDESYLAEGALVHNCPFRYLHDTPDDEGPADFDQAIEAIARSYKIAKQRENEAKAISNEAKKRLDEQLGSRDKVESENYKVTRITSTQQRVDMDKLAETVGKDTIDAARKPQVVTQIRVTEKKKKEVGDDDHANNND